MKGITLKEGTTQETAVFEKTGLTLEFTIDLIDSYVDGLETQKLEVANKLILEDGQIDKLVKPDLSALKEKQYIDFAVYARYQNQIKFALEQLAELLEANPNFDNVYNDLEAPQDAPKYIDSIEKKKALTSEYEALESTIAEYLADKDTALSCLK